MKVEVNIDTSQFDSVVRQLAEIIINYDLKTELVNTKLTIDLTSLIKPEIIIKRNTQS